MNPVIEDRLQRVSRRIQDAQAIRLTAMLLCFLTLLLLLVLVGVASARITRMETLWACVAMILFLGFLAWIVLLVASRLPVPQQDLVRETERTTVGLLDRLHTLASLESSRRDPEVDSYAARIEAQSVPIVGGAAPVPLRLKRHAWHWIGAWLGLLLITMACFVWVQPFHRLALARQAQDADPKPSEMEIPVAEKESSASELADGPWIEVRVVRPGRDLIVRPDVSLPLRVEAATDGSLVRTDLHLAINGRSLWDREISMVNSPGFSRGELELDLKSAGARTWDVFSYRATARNDAGLAASSRLFFLDVWPSPQELDALPHGRTGEAYQLLNELTALVNAQEEILRNLHDLHRVAPESRDSRKLSELADALAGVQARTRQIEASLPREPGLVPVQERLNHASEYGEKASEHLRSADLENGAAEALRALGQVAVTRRDIHEAVQADPDILPAPTVDPVTDMAEWVRQFEALQKQLRSATDEANDMARQQRQLVEQIRPRSQEAEVQAALDEAQLQEKFQQFCERNGAACQAAPERTAATTDALGHAANSFQKLADRHDAASSVQARGDGTRAAKNLQGLAVALNQQFERNQLAALEQLRRALEQQMDAFDRLQADPDAMTPVERELLARSAMATADQLRRLANRPGTRELLSELLRQRLSGDRKKQLNQQCQGICQNADGDARSAAAALARSSVQGILQALDSGMERVAPIRVTRDWLASADPNAWQSPEGQMDEVRIERIEEHDPAGKPKVTHFNPQDYPPGYRDWIQRYYQRLAEEP